MQWGAGPALWAGAAEAQSAQLDAGQQPMAWPVSRKRVKDAADGVGSPASPSVPGRQPAMRLLTCAMDVPLKVLVSMMSAPASRYPRWMPRMTSG